MWANCAGESAGRLGERTSEELHNKQIPAIGVWLDNSRGAAFLSAFADRSVSGDVCSTGCGSYRATITFCHAQHKAFVDWPRLVPCARAEGWLRSMARCRGKSADQKLGVARPPISAETMRRTCRSAAAGVTLARASSSEAHGSQLPRQCLRRTSDRACAQRRRLRHAAVRR